MEKRFVHSVNGEEVRQQDINLMSDDGALADDRVLWEFIRTLPGSATPDKLIIPYATRAWSKLSGSTSTALVWGNSSDAKVHIAPFRAIVGSTTVIGTSPIENMRGMRSGYLLGTSALWSELTIAANASGNPRWTLIYAAVTPDANGDSAAIKVKDPTTQNVAPSTLVVNKKTTVTLGQIDGTPAATPTRPALPSDGAGTYYIALAYIYVDTGFGPTSIVPHDSISEVAECATLSSATGGMACRPANQSYKNGGTVQTRQPSYSFARAGAFLPSVMVGGERRVILLQLGLAPNSHTNGDVVDDSVDWRFRYFKSTVFCKGGGTTGDAFASDAQYGAGTAPAGSALGRNAHATCQGQSFVNDSSAMILVASTGVALYLTDADLAGMAVGSKIQLYVRNTDGALMFTSSGGPSAQFVIWLDATGPYSNFGTV